MTIVEPWEYLRKELVEALRRPTTVSWFEIWQLFLADPWYNAELTKHARSILRSTGAPAEWLEDLQHEAMLILAGKLQKAADLGLDTNGLGEKFPASIGTIARNECRQALKRLRRIYRTGAPLLDDSNLRASVRYHELEEQSLELSMAIDELPEPSCSVLRLSQLGFDIGAIAEGLGITYWKAYRAFRRGLDRVRIDLNRV